MIGYIKQKLNEGYYIATHGRWEANEGNIYSPSSIGGITLMKQNGHVDYEIKPRDFNAIMMSMDLIGLSWGDKTTGHGGGVEYRTKECHEKELSNE